MNGLNWKGAACVESQQVQGKSSGRIAARLSSAPFPPVALTHRRLSANKHHIETAMLAVFLHAYQRRHVERPRHANKTGVCDGPRALKQRPF